MQRFEGGGGGSAVALASCGAGVSGWRTAVEAEGASGSALLHAAPRAAIAKNVARRKHDDEETLRLMRGFISPTERAENGGGICSALGSSYPYSRVRIL